MTDNKVLNDERINILIDKYPITEAEVQWILDLYRTKHKIKNPGQIKKVNSGGETKKIPESKPSKEEIPKKDSKKIQSEQDKKEIEEIVTEALQTKPTKPVKVSGSAHNVWSLEGIPAIGPTNVSRLIEAGITSYHGLISEGPVSIHTITGIPMDKCNSAVKHCRKALIDSGKMTRAMRSGIELYGERKELGLQPTGNKALDKNLGGGFETASLIECYGAFGSGKTQFAHTLAVLVQKEPNIICPKCKKEFKHIGKCDDCFIEKEIDVEDKGKTKFKMYQPLINTGGLGGNVLFIDTENTFSPNRIVDIAMGRGLDPEKVLENIQVERVFSTAEQRSAISGIDGLISENQASGGRKLKLVIVDSMTALPRAEYQGVDTSMGYLARRQQHINHMMTTLKRQSEVFKLLAFVTNQVFEDINQSFGDNVKPVGGSAMGHAPTIRLYVKKSGKADAEGQKGIIRMIDSSEHINFENLYCLTENFGFGDAKAKKEDKD